jgi:two-component system, chemotaxis family, chemotaxis protein CheY
MSTSVMLIDDSAETRTETSQALAAAGFSVIEAVDAADALEKLASSGDVALIVCDADGPQSGLDFFEELSSTRTRHTTPPVIMVAGEGHPELMRHARECGARGCMVKPLKPDVLVAALRKLTAAVPT